MHCKSRSLLQRSLLIVLAAHLCLREVAAVKRTMPMIGMDEEGEEVDPEDDMPATQQPRNALKSMVDGFLGQVSAHAPSIVCWELS